MCDLGDGDRPRRPATLAQRWRKPTYRIQPTKGWAGLNVREIWRYRDLLWVLVQRDIKLLYKQTALGVVWVVAQPLVAAVIFAVVFRPSGEASQRRRAVFIVRFLRGNRLDLFFPGAATRRD